MSVTKPVKPAPTYSVVPSAEGFAVHRDDKVMKTPAGADFILPSRNLAEEIAKEWRAQGNKVIPSSMPMTQLAATSIDIVSKDRAKIVGNLAAYIDSELLCHRAEEPVALAERQTKIWQPLLDWCEKTFGAKLKTGAGITPIRQSEETKQVLCSKIENYDAFRLTGLRQTADVSGSLILGMALAESQLTAEQIFETAELDALFQMEKWGKDPETAKRHAEIRKDMKICEKWFALN